MAIWPYVARLRAHLGTELLLLPSAAVLPVDPRGRILLVHRRGHHDGWGLVGGAVEIGESPARDRRSWRGAVGVGGGRQGRVIPAYRRNFSGTMTR
ncbi:NUDIX domain-containing protein [Plantactinospora sp. B5E13]|uniref:NUDIX domain-containing protein n=1 Tax=Plantactinospora sp. B5E13 TaxID=3153758 RepID=UPI00325E3A08